MLPDALYFKHRLFVLTKFKVYNIKVYGIGLQRYRKKKIIVGNKDSIPSQDKKIKEN